ncbi:hypothetical protein IscW_ISCW003374 [Ixodes scapularis]|uniref:Uncharacterized protein n=1 Tax=Ixodes scapularis TaxID=6945 RepID=B7PCY4_IXOSC|nr:hypothetical protein IscW_ISCW003374 [Ixodes scapularis]|eukprot:XP_002410437.1 hypothetical protein IscW_ISCW003374 [Ixodes scapularis]
MDFLLSLYRIKIKSRKWTLRALFHFVDIAVCNAWLEYIQDHPDMRRSRLLDLMHFRLQIAEALITSVGQIVSRRYDVRAFVQTFKSAVNSSMFISQNFFFYLVFGCISRKHGYFEDPVTFVIRHLFGAEELHGTESKKTKHASLLVNGGCQANGIEDGKDPRCNATSPVNGTARVNGSGIVDGFETISSKKTSHAKRIVHVDGNRDVNANEKCFTNEQLPTLSSQRCLAVRVLTSRHLSCQHPFGCLAQFCRNMAKFASLGWAVGFGIGLLGDLKRLPGRRRPFLAHVLGPSSLRSACFLGGLTGIYKLLSCSLRWASNGQRDWHGLVAGSAAGLAAVAAPNSNASLYLLWKLIEAILEPHNLRPQYLKFLDDICGNLRRSSDNNVPWKLPVT